MSVSTTIDQSYAGSAGGVGNMIISGLRSMGLTLLGVAGLLAVWWLGGWLIASNPSTASFADFAPAPTLKKFVEIVASGGLMLNYNIPYADIYMQTRETHREKGYATYIVQELKRIAYRMGRVPAARCNIGNRISQATLEKAGMRVCGFRLKGAIRVLED